MYLIGIVTRRRRKSPTYHTDEPYFCSERQSREKVCARGGIPSMSDMSSGASFFGGGSTVNGQNLIWYSPGGKATLAVNMWVQSSARNMRTSVRGISGLTHTRRQVTHTKTNEIHKKMSYGIQHICRAPQFVRSQDCDTHEESSRTSNL